MRGISQVVALLLLLTALVRPAVALGLCRTPQADAPVMNCPPDCPMMAQHSVGSASTDESAQGRPCCKFSSYKPAPVAESTVPVATAYALAAPVETSPLIPVPAVPQHHDRTAQVLAPVSNPQSVLCTFLI